MRIGMGQLLVEGGEPERNLKRAGEMIAQAVRQGCDLVLLPETLDFGWTHPSALAECRPIPGPFSELLTGWAAEHKIFVCAGLTEQAEGKRYNAAIFIDPQGKILLKYHKINLLSVEQPFYEIGSHLEVVETRFGKIGVNICADNYADGLPIGHTLARMGAQVLISPSSWTVDYSINETQDPYKEKWIRPYTTLARLYNMVVIGTTSVGYIVGGPYEGKKMIGCSLAVGPSGILARGAFNEFAGDLIVVDFEVPLRREKGTEIGAMLKHKGFELERML